MVSRGDEGLDGPNRVVGLSGQDAANQRGRTLRRTFTQNGPFEAFVPAPAHFAGDGSLEGRPR